MNFDPGFLIPDATVLLEIVAVLVLFAVLSRSVLPRLRIAAEDRRLQAQAVQEQLLQSTADREASQREAADLIIEARLEARQILTDARTLRDLILADARERAHEESASILARADRAAARGIPQPVKARHVKASPGQRAFAASTSGR